jgi:subtilase family serine protease
VNVDGGPVGDSAVSEADGDIEDVVGLAPDVSVLVYAAPNSAAGWLDNWNAAVSDDRAKVISISWGICEPLSSPDFEAENTILEQAAAQGQTFLSAAGDSGSEDCLGPNNANDFTAVDDPGSQPYMTAVGGTQWAVPGAPPKETAWNDGVLTCAGISDCYGAGGGGISQNWTMPPLSGGRGAQSRGRQRRFIGNTMPRVSGRLLP